MAGKPHTGQGKGAGDRASEKGKTGGELRGPGTAVFHLPFEIPGRGPGGWFGPGKMVAAFEQACKRLSNGSLSDVVSTQFGYHIIKLLVGRTKTLMTRGV